MLTNKRFRRRLVLSTIGVTLLAIPIGLSVLSPILDSDVRYFSAFWGAILLGVIAIILLALIDMRMIQKEHQQRKRELEGELAQIIADAEAAMSDESAPPKPTDT